jgi:hypothetical protein
MSSLLEKSGQFSARYIIVNTLMMLYDRQYTYVPHSGLGFDIPLTKAWFTVGDFSLLLIWLFSYIFLDYHEWWLDQGGSDGLGVWNV